MNNNKEFSKTVFPDKGSEDKKHDKQELIDKAKPFIMSGDINSAKQVFKTYFDNKMKEHNFGPVQNNCGVSNTTRGCKINLDNVGYKPSTELNQDITKNVTQEISTMKAKFDKEFSENMTKFKEMEQNDEITKLTKMDSRKNLLEFKH